MADEGDSVADPDAGDDAEDSAWTWESHIERLDQIRKSKGLPPLPRVRGKPQTEADEVAYWEERFEDYRKDARDAGAVAAINTLWIGLGGSYLAVLALSVALDWQWNAGGVAFVMMASLLTSAFVVSQALEDMAIVKRRDYDDLVKLAEWGVREDLKFPRWKCGVEHHGQGHPLVRPDTLPRSFRLRPASAGTSFPRRRPVPRRSG